jgi:hypothetical protein
LFLNENLKRQRGQALLMLLVILTIGFSAAFYALTRPTGSAIERDKITAAALAQAKAALIGYAAGVSNLAGGDRPGDLPCPDSNDSGGFGASCDTPATRIGRLPWKRLGLPDLRDGDGERLWYAVSDNFKYNTRTACVAPGNAGCLNSDSRGTITIRNTAGTVINNGTNPDPFTPSGVIAVIFAPGATLQRQGAGAPQDRSCTGGSCTPAGVCTSSPVTNTPKCNPVNYLDVLTGIEDNADFVDGSNTNGFINGVIRDANKNVIVNDRLITITYQDLMPVLQRRVAQEVLNCLTAYAGNAQNNGRYPWAAPVTNITTPYADAVDTTFGRVPDTLNLTELGGAGGVANLACPASPTVCMSPNWPTSCGITQGSWWTNWKEMVFYGVADAYKPADPILGGGVPASGGCGLCLTIDPPSASADKRVVVAIAGKRLAVSAYPAGNNQPRSLPADKQNPNNYLEGQNNNPPVASIYEQQPISTSFSDFLLYQ